LSPPGGKAKRGKEETLELFKHAWLTVFDYITVCLLIRRNADLRLCCEASETS
jgi:hypothetical protein